MFEKLIGIVFRRLDEVAELPNEGFSRVHGVISGGTGGCEGGLEWRWMIVRGHLRNGA
jgi:hypothetical protein